MDGVVLGREQNQFSLATRAAVRPRTLDGMDGHLMDPVLNRSRCTGKAEHVAQPRQESPACMT